MRGTKENKQSLVRTYGYRHDVGRISLVWAFQTVIPPVISTRNLKGQGEPTPQLTEEVRRREAERKRLVFVLNK